MLASLSKGNALYSLTGDKHCSVELDKCPLIFWLSTSRSAFGLHSTASFILQMHFSQSTLPIVVLRPWFGVGWKITTYWKADILQLVLKASFWTKKYASDISQRLTLVCRWELAILLITNKKKYLSKANPFVQTEYKSMTKNVTWKLKTNNSYRLRLAQD